jgi:hypothetical protein
MKKYFLFLISSIFLVNSFAQVMAYSAGAKEYFDKNPGKVANAIGLTDQNSWAKCVNVWTSMMAAEVRGQKWDDNTSATFALLGEAMGRVRGSFLAKGFSQSSLDNLIKSYSGRQLDVPEMRYCNVLINNITK